MSSIVVQGDTSGSVILEAPAVAGTVTVTLPATSGTMAVSGASQSFTDVAATGNLTVDGNTILGNASTDTLNVGNGGLVKDASGNVGIGAAPTNGKLDVYVDGGINLALTKTTGAYLAFYNGTTARGCINGLSGADGLAFGTGASFTERMRIDSSGRVTTPYQPYFYAGSTHTGTLISSALMPYDTVTANIGNHYNTSTYLFTAPIAGRYLFTFSALNYPSSSTAELFFTVNGGSYTSLVRNNSIVAQQSIAGSAILNLSANDTVGVKGTLYFYATAGHGQFSGIFLG